MLKSTFQRYRHIASIFFLFFLNIFVSCGSKSHHKDMYVIARSPSWEGMNLSGSESNLLGFSDDLLYEIARRGGFEVQLLRTQGSPLPSLDQENVDGALCSLAPTSITKKIYEFSEPYYTTGPVLIVLKDSPVRTAHDLEGGIIGFERNSSWNFQMKNKVQVTFRPYDGITNAIEDLQDHYIDAIVVDAIVAHRLASGLYKKVIRIAGPPIQPAYLRLVVVKGKDEELITLFNTGLDSIKKDGLYDKMLIYWGLFSAEE